MNLVIALLQSRTRYKPRMTENKQVRFSRTFWIGLLVVLLGGAALPFIRITPNQAVLTSKIKMEICGRSPCTITFTQIADKDKSAAGAIKTAIVELDRAVAMHQFGMNPYGTPAGSDKVKVTCWSEPWNVAWVWNSIVSYGVHPTRTPETIVYASGGDSDQSSAWIETHFKTESAANLYYEIAKNRYSAREDLKADFVCHEMRLAEREQRYSLLASMMRTTQSTHLAKVPSSVLLDELKAIKSRAPASKKHLVDDAIKELEKRRR